jgi:hypothetical protein
VMSTSMCGRFIGAQNIRRQGPGFNVTPPGDSSVLPFCEKGRGSLH